MTLGVYQGQRCLPAGIPGISTALSQEDRLWPKGRLRQQPAGNSTEESWSRVKTTRPFQRPFRRSGLAPTRSTKAKDGHDASHAWAQPISEQESSPQKNLRQKGGHMPPRCRSKEESHFIKWLPSEGARGSCERRSHGGAGCRAAGHPICNQTPAYIKGSGPIA
jgi:hypothetical protein